MKLIKIILYFFCWLCNPAEKGVEKVAPPSDWHTVQATYYHPVANQTQGNPLITASGKKIDLELLEKGHLKWIAVSRDLLERYNYGDTVSIVCSEDASLNGRYVIYDTMAKRFKNKIDFLWPKGKKHEKGVWKVRMRKD